MRRKETAYLTALGVGLALLLSPLFYANYRRVRLILWGEPSTATIVRLHDTGDRYREHPEVEMTVELESDDGVPYWVTVRRAVPHDQRARYEVGAELDVQVDPNDPQVVGITGVHDTTVAQTPSRTAGPATARTTRVRRHRGRLKHATPRRRSRSRS